MVIHLKNENFQDEIKEGRILVDFHASWCGPCKMLSPIIDEIGSERGDIKIVKVDIDEHEELARQYGIMSVPTLLLFENGKIVKNHTGFFPKEILEKWIVE